MDIWSPPPTEIPSSPALSALEDAFSQLLTGGVTHGSIKAHLQTFMVERAKALPPTKVLFNSSDRNSFQIDPEVHQHILNSIPDVIPDAAPIPDSDAMDFSVELSPYDTFYRCHRNDPAVFAAITEYGRLASFDLPHVADVIRTSHTLGLANAKVEILYKMSCPGEWEWEVSALYPELPGRAKAFREARMVRRREDSQKGIYESKPPASARFKDFAVQNPDKWMDFEVFGFPGKEMMRFVLMLLDEDYNRYYVPPDLETELGREREQAVYETIGIACCGSMIGVAEVPAGMAYYIRDFDGEEFVQWGEL